ncbi:MAG TPA: PLP-dependent transferase [Actinopolymorphaceae bacterium]
MVVFTPATLAVHSGRPSPDPDAPLNYPPVPASTFVAGGNSEYGRFGNPTWTAFEDALGALEGGRALAFASGLAAVSAVLSRVPPDGIVVAPHDAYSGTLQLLRELPLRDVRLVDVADTDTVVRAAEDASLVWLESPTNPGMAVADLPTLCRLDPFVVVDNTFATPMLQRPLDHGADVVVHSVSKHIAGHSDVNLGAIVTGHDTVHDELLAHRTSRGAIPGPFETWLALRGLRTLHLRMERSSATALELARRLAEHPAIERVRYPGLPSDPGHARASRLMSSVYGGIVCVEVRGGAAAADAVVAKTSLWVHATSLGGVESTLERRRRWPAESPSVPENLLRLSVGIEDVEDLWRDLAQALA